jgi:hypothetical protein
MPRQAPCWEQDASERGNRAGPSEEDRLAICRRASSRKVLGSEADWIRTRCPGRARGLPPHAPAAFAYAGALARAIVHADGGADGTYCVAHTGAVEHPCGNTNRGADVKPHADALTDESSD